MTLGPTSDPLLTTIPALQLTGPSAASDAHPVIQAPLARRRAGDAERGSVCDQLAAHYAAGRLSAEELEARLDAAMKAVYILQLHSLVTDLPPLTAVPVPSGVGVGAVGAAGGSAAATQGAGRNPWSSMDIIALVVVIGTLLGAGLLTLGLGLGAGVMVVFFCFLGGCFAALGGGALIHLAHSRRPRG